jgi:hypothetical protein
VSALAEIGGAEARKALTSATRNDDLATRIIALHALERARSR